MNIVQTKHIRNSSIEILKLLAIVMIVFSHALPENRIDLSEATTDIQQLIMVFMKYAGQLGNAIFIVCSAWFLLDSKKASIHKVAHIVCDSFCISVLLLLGFVLWGVQVPIREIVKRLIPITMNLNWFVGCYIIFYLIHPGLNIIIQSMNQDKLLKCNLILGFFYCVIQTVIRDRYYYTQVVGFICIYFFTAYMKTYMVGFIRSERDNIKCFLAAAVCFTLSIILLNLAGLKIGILHFYLKTWSVITNPFLIVMAMSLFNLFYGKTFYSKSVNYISGLSLLIYIIHADRLVQGILKIRFFEVVNEVRISRVIIIWCFILGICLFVLSVLLSTLYKETIQKKLYCVCDWVVEKIISLGERGVCLLISGK